MKAFASSVVMNVFFAPLFGWTGAASGVGEDVLFNSADGSLLEGVLIRTHREESLGALILCHPFTKYGQNYFFRNGLARDFADGGFDVFTFNFKGFGNSKAHGLRFADDVSGAVHYVRSRFGVRPIFILGQSFGGFHLAQFMATPVAAEVSGAIFDSVPIAVSRFFRRGFLGFVMRSLEKSRFNALTGTSELRAVIPVFADRALLVLRGSVDKMIEADDWRELSLAGERSTYIGADHLELHKRERPRYLKEITDFLHRTEGKDPVQRSRYA